MKNKWKFFIASGAFALLLAGCGKESTNQKTQVSETAEQTDNDLDDGLGSAMRKLYKGYNGEARFAKYKTKRK